jgi:hypothetical protein
VFLSFYGAIMRIAILLTLTAASSWAQAVNYRIATTAGIAQPGDGGPATAAPLTKPISVVVDGVGNIYVSESTGMRIRKISPDGKISTFAGNSMHGIPSEGARANETSIALNVDAMAIDPAGNLYAAMDSNWFVHKISPDGIITKFAGASCCSNAGQGDGGPALRAIVGRVNGITADGAGNVYLAGASRVRKVDSKGVITLVAGTGEAGYAGDNGPATSAKLSDPQQLALDTAGNLYIADSGNSRIRRVTPDGRITTFAGGGSKTDGPPTEVSLPQAGGLAIDSNGALYVSSRSGNRIWRIAPASLGALQASVIAGTGTGGFSGDGGPATNARIKSPQ